MPRITVTMPTCDRAHLIGRAIRSLGRQTYRDFELLVGDDGCKDDTLATVEREAARAGVPFRIINEGKPGIGLPAMRNRLVSASDSEFVAVLDDDDETLPDRLETGLRMMEADARLAIVGGAIICREETGGEWTGRRPTTDMGIRRRALRGGTFYHVTTMMRRSHLSSQEPYDETMPRSQDSLLWAEMTKRDELRFANTSKVMTIKHEHGQQANEKVILAGHRKVHERLTELNAEVLAKHGAPRDIKVAKWLATYKFWKVDPRLIPDPDRICRVYGALDRRWRRIAGLPLAAAIDRKTPWHARPHLRRPPSLACSVLALRGLRVADAVRRRLAGRGSSKDAAV